MAMKPLPPGTKPSMKYVMPLRGPMKKSTPVPMPKVTSGRRTAKPMPVAGAKKKPSITATPKAQTPKPKIAGLKKMNLDKTAGTQRLKKMKEMPSPKISKKLNKGN